MLSLLENMVVFVSKLTPTVMLSRLENMADFVSKLTPTARLESMVVVVLVIMGPQRYQCMLV